MTRHEELMRGTVIRRLAAGEPQGRVARQTKVAAETVDRWWLEYERRCGEVGRVQALQEWGAA